VVVAVEQVNGEKWDTFANRYQDWGRDLALYLGRKRVGMKLEELGQLAGGIDHATLSNRVRWFEAAQKQEAKLLDLVKHALQHLERRKL
jgi:chromosomal replication initiation ATPase DnaA